MINALLPMLPSVSLTLVVSIAAVVVVRRIAMRYGVVDDPAASERKKHRRPIPLLGGVAVIGAFVVGIGVAAPELVGGFLLPKHLIGIGLAAGVLGLGGALDDRYDLAPQWQILFPVVAALLIIAAGIGVEYVTNPFGGVLYLDQWSVTLFSVDGTPYQFLPLADGLTFVWLLGMMYTTKFLDGVDGLVSGVTMIGSVIIVLLSLTTVVFQPETAHLAALVFAAFAGFLLFNWPPAKMFLGESGSLFAGFSLGLLSIIAGSKIATTLLIFAIPILDVAWVVLQRVRQKRSPFAGDRAHFHLRLVDAGFSARQAVAILYALTIVFGFSGLVLDSERKIFVLVVAAATMALLVLLILRRSRRSV